MSKPQLITSLPVVYVKPGECHFSSKPELVITVLGSCLSVVMFNVERCVSSMCHCVLPSISAYSKDNNDNIYKYVDTTIVSMLKVFEEKRIYRDMLAVKVFGGAEQLTKRRERQHAIGKQNVIKALDILEKFGMKISAMDVGGSKGRKIYLSSHTGEVLLSRLGGYEIVRLDSINEKNKSINSR